MHPQCTCAGCDAPFTPTHQRQKYCSRNCGRRFKHVRKPEHEPARVERSCESCGKTFLTVPSNAARGNAKFCGRACVGRPPEDRLWPRVDKSGECWIFTGPPDTKGYGMVGRGGKGTGIVRAHRLAFEQAYGPIPEGRSVLHTCDTPACVRNDDAGWYEVNGVSLPRRGHLFLGDHKANMVDKMIKGRSGVTKVTDDNVREMRRLAAQGMAYAALGRRYGLTGANARKAVLGITWQHVE